MPIKQRWSVWIYQSALPQLVQLPLLVISHWHYWVQLMSILALLHYLQCWYVVCLNHCWCCFFLCFSNWGFIMQSYRTSWSTCFSKGCVFVFQYKHWLWLHLYKLGMFSSSFLHHHSYTFLSLRSLCFCKNNPIAFFFFFFTNVKFLFLKCECYWVFLGGFVHIVDV